MTDTHENSGPPPFDEELAASYVGKYILLGLTYEDHEGNELRREQIHGVITSAGCKGIEISLRGAREGETWSMPPDLRGHCQSNLDYFSKTSKPELTAIDFPGFFRVDLSGSMAAPNIWNFALTMPNP